MHIRCGTDIIEIFRIKKSIENFGSSFINKIFTEQEIAYCESKGQQKYQHYAARFAAKEATFKAISESLQNKFELDWKDYEVICDENDKPNIFMKKIDFQEIESIDLSISHCKEYAVANVVALFK